MENSSIFRKNVTIVVIAGVNEFLSVIGCHSGCTVVIPKASGIMYYNYICTVGKKSSLKFKRIELLFLFGNGTTINKSISTISCEEHVVCII